MDASKRQYGLHSEYTVKLKFTIFTVLSCLNISVARYETSTCVVKICYISKYVYTLKIIDAC